MFGNQENTLWVEKFRPGTLEGYVGNEHIIDKVKLYLENGDVPHLLFYGQAGTGKTTLAKIIANGLDADIMYINASDENNVDTVRTKIKNYASTIGFKKWKIVILDEADYMTPNGQAALRNLMETFSNGCQRQVIDNELKIEATSVIQANYMTKLLDLLKSSSDKKTAFKDIRQLIADSKVKDFTALHKYLFDELDNYATGHIASIILILAESQYQDSFAVDKELHIMSTIVKMLNELK